jgi:hypothetical protein
VTTALLYRFVHHLTFIKILKLYRWPGVLLLCRVGTPYYVAPEVLRQSYSFPADVWSAGVTAYQLLTGRFPWHADPDWVEEQVRYGAAVMLLHCYGRCLSLSVWVNARGGAVVFRCCRHDGMPLRVLLDQLLCSGASACEGSVVGVWSACMLFAALALFACVLGILSLCSARVVIPRECPVLCCSW